MKIDWKKKPTLCADLYYHNYSIEPPETRKRSIRVRDGSIRGMARRERSKPGPESGLKRRRPDGADLRSRSEAVGAIA